MPTAIKDLPCGAKIRFGKYRVGEEIPHDIKWIKVNSGDTKLFAEYVEDFRAFDARERNNPNNNRREYGNNRYSVANIDQFLNSANDVFYRPAHDYDAPPTKELTYDNMPYDNHPGFLADFNEAELDAIMPTEVIVAIPKCDDAENAYETITRKVFLPSRTNIFGGTVRNVHEGTQWEIFQRGDTVTAKTTNEARRNPNITDFTVNEGDNWYYWLRSPSADDGCDARCVGRGGNGSYASAYHGVIGVRPALTINPEILVSDEPDEEGYYNVILSAVELKDVSEEDFFSVILG